MIEKILLDYLTDALDCPVYLQQPDPAPAEYVLLERVGGGEKNHVRTASVAIQSYGSSLLAAATRNESVLAAMRDAAALPALSRAALNSDYNFSDTARRRWRYQAVYDFVLF